MSRWIKILIILFAILLFGLLVQPAIHLNGQSDAEAVARVILFHSPTCPHCRIVINETLPPLQAKYGEQLEVRLYDLSTQEGYGAFAALIEAVPDMPTGIPQAYIDSYVLLGSQQIPEQLPMIIDKCLANGGCDWSFTFVSAESPLPEETETPAQQIPIYLAYVYDATCLQCDAVSYHLENLGRDFPMLEIHQYDVEHDSAMIDAIGEKYGVVEDQRLLAPVIFIGDTYLGTDDITYARLVEIIEGQADQAIPAPWADISEEDLQQAQDRISQRFSEFSLLTIAAAGLLDGLNPCAFTTIIFFISYLTLVGRKGREILFVGASFTIAVFLTYLLMGLGLSAVMESLGDFSMIGKLIYGGTALFCLGLAVFSLYDWFKIRRGQLTEISLQLPTAFKKRIHSTIRQRSRMQGYVGAAFVAGILVSIFELACTGQVYLPTIIFMTSVNEQRLTALFDLVIYNLMFVIPLVIVFVAAYRGTNSQRFTDFFQNNAATVKLLTAVLFTGLGVWLLTTTFAV